MRTLFIGGLSALIHSVSTNAHTAAYAKGMYCRGGPNGDNQNANDPVVPLYQLSMEDWWFQHDRGCDLAPPPEDEFLELPAGGSFEVELAHNQAFTTLSFDGEFTSEWPDGGDHPEDWHGPGSPPDCIQEDGALHVQNESMAAGTAFAISYHSELSEVTLENLAVFTVRLHTPWKRVTSYDVPAAMPACPLGGCTCAWLWVPDGCGEPNMYMQGFKCNVTGATATSPVAPARPPVYCEDDLSSCVQGAKQMIVWQQAEGDNIEPSQSKSPGYNPKGLE
ncbi:hypothetical protein BDY21DRAFT_413702 [Lineolata rhizophorae]|uniref:Proteophosphoglycan ppg4 n=1 Tax=Lineolata rhizophorae TaxID=578093 RepID=A0A6A6P7L9_9PEZI|nr:hypothetical protein BDY21DRAFT_413702 [Lineolata rhizophorae]